MYSNNERALKGCRITGERGVGMEYKYVCEDCQAVTKVETEQDMSNNTEIDCPVCGWDAYLTTED